MEINFEDMYQRFFKDVYLFVLCNVLFYFPTAKIYIKTNFLYKKPIIFSYDAIRLPYNLLIKYRFFNIRH